MQDWAKEHDIEWRLHVSYNPQAAELVERGKKKGTLKQQIKLLIGKNTLARETKVLSQSLRHLSDQPVGPVAPHARLGPLLRHPTP